MVLFPGMVVPIAIGRKTSIAAAQYAVKVERPIGVVLQKNPEADAPGPQDLYPIGTVAGVLRYVTTPDGNHHLICQGQQRFRVPGFLGISSVSTPSAYWAEALVSSTSFSRVKVLEMEP